ncbi:phosphoribosyltransferase family protein [Buttiauxella sp. WJP83]|uniref:phosphoribosyltransferase family protein n=1 Tax=Buttiauxella sp. WJP83 TaxID=2986951 RepID=UPI0022DE3049|nr:phosphoribosyltransferase family protein [Buttiauxella sp. WJP83]WBM70856.1 phosphoribosyltransferase family protein [Buttiauxella sp. WJP83]
MHFKNISSLSHDIRKNLFKINKLDVDLVVGIPRSGMIPAYTIALYLNIDCTDIASFINNTPLKKGNTRCYNNNLSNPHDAKKILLVDDSIDSGRSINNELMRIPQHLKNRVSTLAIYSSSLKRNDVDLFLEYVPHPRVFEWNIYHHPVIEKSCVDIDGVLCIDPTPEENDDGDKYRHFLLNAEPLFIPSVKIHALVTSRLEKYRSETESWLEKHGVQYDSLIMLDLPTKEERIKSGAHSTHKSLAYNKLNASLFIESEIDQAINICKRTGKPVYCVDTNEMIQSSAVNSILKNPSHINKKIIRRLKNIVKEIINRVKVK